MSLEHLALPSPPAGVPPPRSTSPAQMLPTTTATTPTHPNTTSSSTSAPEIRSNQHILPSSIASSPSVDTALAQSSRSASSEALPSPLDTSGTMQTEGDLQIIEALRSKDRLYVLKLGEQMESLITERRGPLELHPATTYQRMLVHKCSSYYKLAPETDSTTKVISVHFRTESRIPARRICELVPAEESTQPAIKIMRRTQDRPRIRHNSQPGSVTGDDADLSDVEPSETGSTISRSNATGGRKYLTIAEREAAYNEARSRIFGLEEKEKEKDMSANSSTFSLSGSGSTSGGRSSMGDADDSASSAATESEWSGPGNREKRDGRRGGSVTSSSRSLRSSDHVFSAPNGSGSSRNSRATSPIAYPTLTPNNPPFEQQYGQQQEPPPHGFMPWFYSYPQPPAHTQAPGQPYVPQYSYYGPFTYPQAPPPQGPPHHSDPTSPAGNEQSYPPQPAPPHPAPYPHYPWAQSPPGGHPQFPMQTSPTAMQPPPPQGPPLQQPNPSHPPQQPFFFIPPGTYPPYPMGGYYQTPTFVPGQPMQSPTPPHVVSAPPFYPPEMMHPRDGNGLSLANGNGGAHSAESSNHSRASSRNSNSHVGTNGVGRRNAPRPRSNWNYGGGVGLGGNCYNNTNGGDTVGPRLSGRRTSSGSASNGNKTAGDEASSTASSSTTSSSSRRTFTSTTSSKHHPLPARPDWAVGMKPSASLHPARPHDPTARTMSPARIGGQPLLNNHGGNQNHPHQPSFPQSTDFPPLSSSSVGGPERRVPTGGAWNNANTMRTIMMPGPPQGAGAGVPGNALVHYPNPNPPPGGPMNVGMNNAHAHLHNTRLDETDRGFERPPPRNPELFNPKGAGRKSNPSIPSSNRASPNAIPPTAGNSIEKEKVGGGGAVMIGGDEMKLATVDGAVVLSEKLAGISLEGGNMNATLPNAGATATVVVEASVSGAAVVGVGAVSS